MAIGGCAFQIDVVAPDIFDDVLLWAKPKDIHDLAAFLMEKCISGLGVGGFGTLDFANVLGWAMDPRTYLYGPIPASSAFITVSIVARRTDLRPGIYDPEVAIALWGASNIAAALSVEHSPDERAMLARAQAWKTRAHQMTRGLSVQPWNGRDTQTSPSAVDEMTYECDSNLGNPTMADCAQIEWTQLGHPSDSLTVGPEATFFHSNTCTLAISAAVTVVLLWQQIQTALAMLMDTCIQFPYQPPRGGRAYYNPQPVKVSRLKNKRQSSVTGLNALPPHANITIFEQREGWTNTSAELDSCTWKAALDGQPTKPCGTG